MSSERMTISMVMDLVDKFSGKTGKINRSVNRMTSNGQKAMKAFRRSTNAALKGLDSLGNRYTAFATGVGGAMAIRNVTQLETRLGRLGIQANKSAEQINNLYQKVVSISQASDIRIDPTQIMDAIDKIIEKTGDFDLATTNIRNVALAIQASGAAGVDIGAMIADLDQKFGIRGKSAMKETLDLMINQGKAGAFTLQNLASQGERVTAAYSVTGRVSKSAAREMGAMLQVARQSTGSAEQAATAFEALMRTLNKAQKRKLIGGKLGVSLTDPDDPKRMRAVTEIVKDLIRATKGDVVILSKVFDAEAMRSLNSVASEFKKTGEFSSLDSFMSQKSDGASLLADAATAADFSASKWQTVLTAINNAVFKNLVNPISKLADILGKTGGGALEGVATAGLYGAAGLVGLSLGAKAYRGIRGMRGKSKIGSSIGGIGGAMGIQRVMVVNWPLSMGRSGGQLSGTFGKSSSRMGRMARSASKAGRFMRMGKGLMRGLPYAGLGFAALDVGSAVLGGGEATDIGNAIGATGGAVAGMAAGAALGSIVPVIGTVIGGAIGGMIGQFGGGALGEKLGGLLKIQIDSEGRATADVKLDNPNMDAEINTGVRMEGAL